ncbi:MAG TPA: FtsX-like permease family protein [Terriglobia bacterium]|nr:FtsX-like permease family protein [Terriglobia bacterium]
MLSRIVGRSLTRKRRRKLLGVAAVALGIGVTTAVATLSLSVGDRMTRELRSFGANISVTPAADSLSIAVGGVDYRPAGAGAFLPESELANLRKIFWRNNIMAFAPYLYAPATVKGRHTVVIGSWFDHALQVQRGDVFQTGLEKLHPAWRVQGAWPRDASRECLVGAALATNLGVNPGDNLTFQSGSPAASTMELRVSGILHTGGEEDDEVLAPLSTVQKFTGLEGKVRRVEVSALTKPEDDFGRSDVTKLSAPDYERWYCTPYVSSIAYQIQQAIPGSEARPVYRVAATEGSIVKNISLLMTLLAIAALVTAALAMASLMFAIVLERRAEIGLFKSLGATNGRVASIFLLEAFAVGIVGGIVGYGLGSWMASRLSMAVFGVPSGIHWVILPSVLALALLVALAGSAVPLARGLKVSPVAVLRNE